MLQIGEKLKKLRIQKGFTQEDAAGKLGVSAQAISRWENSISYPDISLLPSLALLYNISADELLGIDVLRKRETLDAIHSKVQYYSINGQSELAIKILREALKLYPGNFGLTAALGETLAQNAKTPEEIAEGYDLLSSVADNINANLKLRCTALANLVFLAIKQKDHINAQKLCSSLPHVWESRELLFPETVSEEEYTDTIRKTAIMLLSYLCLCIENISDHIPGMIPSYFQNGSIRSPEINVEKSIEKLHTFLCT